MENVLGLAYGILLFGNRDSNKPFQILYILLFGILRLVHVCFAVYACVIVNDFLVGLFDMGRKVIC